MMTDTPPLAAEAAALLLRTRSTSYTPRRAEASALLDLYLRHLPPRGLTEADAKAEREQAGLRADLLRGLDRVAGDALRDGLLRVQKVSGAARRELFALLARWAVLSLSREPGDAEGFAAVLPLLHDADAPAARQIAIVLGRAGHKLAPQPARLLREALLLRLQAAVLPAPADLRAYVEALGKLPAPTDDPSESGPDATLTVLQHVAERAQAGTPLPEVVAAALKTAITRCERAAVRSEVTSTEPAIAIDRVLPCEGTVVLRSRAGLLPLLRSELRERGLLSGAIVSAFDPADTLGSYSPQTSGQTARLRLRWSGSLAEIYTARLFSSLAFDLSPPPNGGRDPRDEEIAEDVIAALTAAPTVRLLQELSQGPVRYRLHFDGYTGRGAAEAALRTRIIEGVRRRAPTLHNDPQASPWQVEIAWSQGLQIELVPRALTGADPRFAYRKGDVPAASHPPLAAAMARLLQAGPRDVVWDPFVGSGSELIEVALLGRGPRLYGSDLDPDAVAVAKTNLHAAGLPLSQVRLQVADVLHTAPAGVSRIVTNPPMGRRTRPGHLADFLSAFIAHCAGILPIGGRLVWISPQPHLSAARGREHGLSLRSARPVDLNGFWGQLEVWDKPAAL